MFLTVLSVNSAELVEGLGSYSLLNKIQDTVILLSRTIKVHSWCLL